jgi:DNA helicase II / ATP-dependent DNA helicase PcrA
MLNINALPDISELSDIDTNFRVFAGPGAGKTTWLIQHLERILKTSTRLHKTRKIACITYTNVAAEEIMNKLNCDKCRLDISTIHSFLYRNIVKPFSYLIEKDEKEEPLFEINSLDGHVEHIPHSDRIRRWQTTIEKQNGKRYGYFNDPKKKKAFLAQLSSMDFSFFDGNIDLSFRNYRNVAIPSKNGELWLYKKKYWLDGIMHHEDVLYFAYRIIKTSPRVLEFIRNKYPYILIDEFQDTTELQTWVIKKIAQSDTKVGVIGDLAQSIYKFAGAKRSDFENFQLENIGSYKLKNNHRSTENIIEFLNCLRTDICQEGTDCTIKGSGVTVLIGTIFDAIKWMEDHDFKDAYILTRKNATVEEIKSQETRNTDDFLKLLYGIDSNSARVRVLHSILMGFKFYEKGYFKDTIKEVLRPLKYKAPKSVSKLQLRNTAIDIIDKLREKETREKTLFQYYDELLSTVQKRHGFKVEAKLTTRAVNAKKFYDNTSISDLIKFIKVDTKSDDTIRTIHSSKGTQFSNVLVHFDALNDFLKYVFNAPKLLDEDADDARIYYVGFSRAKETLFINIPESNNEVIKKIEDLSIGVVILN